MTEIPETYIGLSGTAWAGLSAIATFSAVFVALFLPFFQDRKKNKNMLALIEKELDDNYSLLVKTETCKDQVLGNFKILAFDLKLALAELIKLRTWNEFKYNLAVYSSKEYEKHKDLNDVLEQIAKHREDIIANQEPKKSQAIVFIEGEISSFISKYKEACRLG